MQGKTYQQVDKWPVVTYNYILKLFIEIFPYNHILKLFIETFTYNHISKLFIEIQNNKV